MHDKGWFFRTYKVPRDEKVINQIITEGHSVWNKITSRRTGGL